MPLSALTVHSAEVNIGIVAACLPTLLPLYRLLRNKFIAVHEYFKSRRSRSLQSLWGQNLEPNYSTQTAAGRSQREVEMATPHNAQWVNSIPRVFLKNDTARDEDVEMQIQFARP